MGMCVSSCAWKGEQPAYVVLVQPLWPWPRCPLGEEWYQLRFAASSSWVPAIPPNQSRDGHYTWEEPSLLRFPVPVLGALTQKLFVHCCCSVIQLGLALCDSLRLHYSRTQSWVQLCPIWRLGKDGLRAGVQRPGTSTAQEFTHTNGTPLQYSCLENPWTEEPGRLRSMGSLRVGHDWATWLSLFTFMHWRRKWQPTPVFLPGESQGQRSLMGCCLWGRTESDTTEAT